MKKIIRSNVREGSRDIVTSGLNVLASKADEIILWDKLREFEEFLYEIEHDVNVKDIQKAIDVFINDFDWTIDK